LFSNKNRLSLKLDYNIPNKKFGGYIIIKGSINVHFDLISVNYSALGRELNRDRKTVEKIFLLKKSKE